MRFFNFIKKIAAKEKLEIVKSHGDTAPNSRGLPRHRRWRNAFGLIQEYCTMALFTGKGDKGTTKFFDTPSGVRISKSSCRSEALGASDELNSFLGLCKVKSQSANFSIPQTSLKLDKIIEQVQQSLFIIQAELAGADKTIEEEKVKNMEKIINLIEAEMPPIKTFFISGGTELAAFFDVSRTLARKMERDVIRALEKEEAKVSDHTRAYINRLSSLLYALARLTNHLSGIKEESPTYE